MDRSGRTSLLILVLTGSLAPALHAQSTAVPQPVPGGLPVLQPAGAEAAWTLERLEALADQYNPILPRDRAQIESARGSALQAGLWSNPRFDSNNPQVINGRNSALNFGVQQEIPVMGKKRLDQAASTEAARQAEITYHQDRFALLTAVRQQFYLVLADQRRVEVLGELVQVVRDAYATGLKRQKAGDVSRADTLVLLVDLQRVEANLRSARAVLDGDLKQLSAIVGVPNLPVRRVAGRLVGGYPTFDEEALRRFVALEHTQVRLARSVIEQYRYQLRRAEVEPYPNPYLGPAYQYGLLPGQDQFWFNIQFSIPVWDRNQGGIRAARGNLSAAQESLRTAQNNLLNQAANLLSQYQAALEVVRQFESGILPNTRESVRLAREGYAKGLTDFATFLAVQRTYVEASSSYVDALQNLWNNAAQLSGLLQMERFP